MGTCGTGEQGWSVFLHGILCPPPSLRPWLLPTHLGLVGFREQSILVELTLPP